MRTSQALFQDLESEEGRGTQVNSISGHTQTYAAFLHVQSRQCTGGSHRDSIPRAKAQSASDVNNVKKKDLDKILA